MKKARSRDRAFSVVCWRSEGYRRGRALRFLSLPAMKDAREKPGHDGE
jgi:hypothetical protein